MKKKWPRVSTWNFRVSRCCEILWYSFWFCVLLFLSITWKQFSLILLNLEFVQCNQTFEWLYFHCLIPLDQIRTPRIYFLQRSAHLRKKLAMFAVSFIAAVNPTDLHFNLKFDLNLKKSLKYLLFKVLISIKNSLHYESKLVVLISLGFFGSRVPGAPRSHRKS